MMAEYANIEYDRTKEELPLAVIEPISVLNLDSRSLSLVPDFLG
jgi:hypothetical protein